MAMHPRRKYRDRHHTGFALGGEGGVFAEGEFGHVPFEIAGEPKGDLLDRGKNERSESDAVSANEPLRDLAHMLVVDHREREMHRCDAGRLDVDVHRATADGACRRIRPARLSSPAQKPPRGHCCYSAAAIWARFVSKPASEPSTAAGCLRSSCQSSDSI